MSRSINTPRAEAEIRDMFDGISFRYDILNTILSFGIDGRWRKKMRRFLPDKADVRLLDVATGTGEQIISLITKGGRIRSALGIDLSEDMIRMGERKLMNKPYAHRVTLAKGNATDIRLEEGAVDCVTISFGIRNIVDTTKCLRECRRVLSRNGRLLILEFSLPTNRIIRNLYLFYLRRILPRIGGFFSKNRHAYEYLGRTILSFPYGKTFCDLMEGAGFTDVRAHPLTFGVATLYVGELEGKRVCPPD
ncbi:MAG: bifunctional demethylmenaquinone methyltransferase/2-methoxy-6-polyprenyl-1,4-benzoquinol methylase UbiE [Simkaniaceae bacterium]|nr:bifunctional demethylmenaquinone methyltransferase/2-methoxy-6-polyprenyl-1,4-benzoquinol methylase UbiE [Simkaniaceae bacterium]